MPTKPQEIHAYMRQRRLIPDPQERSRYAVDYRCGCVKHGNRRDELPPRCDVHGEIRKGAVRRLKGEEKKITR